MAQDLSSWNHLFVELSKEHWNSLLRFAVSLCGNAERADDLLQTALIKALAAFPRFVEKNFSVNDIKTARELLLSEPNHNYLKNWLFRITKNAHLDDFATSRSWLYESVQDDQASDTSAGSPEDFALESASRLNEIDLPTAERSFYRLALDDDWAKRLEELTPKQRTVLFLAAEGYAYKEIATILEIPIGTVMSTLSRSISRLKNGTGNKCDPSSRNPPCRKGGTEDELAR